MEKNEKKCQVHLIETNTRSNIVLSLNNNILFFDTTPEIGKNPNSNFKYKHLYITSDDEIKEGDWFIFKNEYILQAQIVNEYTIISYQSYSNTNDLTDWNVNDCKKIIATTDTLFPCPKGTMCNYLPQPSETFITKYIESYNKEEVIKEVMVEYDYIITNEDFSQRPVQFSGYLQLKVNPKDNTITIRKIKDSYNTLEVSGLLRRFENECFLKFYKDKDYTDRVLFLGEFIERNL